MLDVAEHFEGNVPRLRREGFVDEDGRDGEAHGGVGGEDARPPTVLRSHGPLHRLHEGPLGSREILGEGEVHFYLTEIVRMELKSAFSEVGYEGLDGPPGEVVVQRIEVRVPFVAPLRRISTAVLMLTTFAFVSPRVLRLVIIERLDEIG